MPLSKINRPGLNTGIADSSDATAITIDSGEKVGIGVTPERQLHVEGSGAEISLVDTQRTSGSRTANMFIDSSDRANLRMMNDAMDSAAVGVQFDSSGRVTMPNQPMFTVNGVSAVSTSPGSSQVLNFSGVYLNVGNHFNISQDRFVAPVAGYYFFAYSCMTTTQSHTSNIVIRKNGGGRHSSYTQNATYLRHNIAVVEVLAANDYVDIVLEHGGIHAGFDHFSGFLIG